MVEVGDRVLVESEKVGAITRSGVVTKVDGRLITRALGLRIIVDVRAKRRLPAGHRPRAASRGGRQLLRVPPVLHGIWAGQL